ncbi:sulfite exporter TauE/SafE family protein [Candidatus Saccharibacteria bacterium]|nr:sulfite exporter TauE/SafE family protein [Candidatus Saccharibacteria bacterium]
MADFLIPDSFQLWHLPLLFFASLLGESFGTVVGGGSLITQPALLATGLPLNAAIATDNAGQLGAEAGILSETRDDIRKRWKLAIFLFIPLALGGLLGTWSLVNASAGLIKPIVIGAVSVLLIYNLFFRHKLQRLRLRKRRYLVMFAFLFVLGVYDNFIGIGEGTFLRFGAMVILGLSFMQIHGLRVAATIPIRFYALVVTGLAGLMAWIYLPFLWLGGFLAGRYVTKYLKQVPEKYIRPSMAVMALAFIAYLLFI